MLVVGSHLRAYDIRVVYSGLSARIVKRANGFRVLLIIQSVLDNSDL